MSTRLSCLVSLSAEGRAQGDPLVQGVWEDPFNHQGTSQFTHTPPTPWTLHPNEGIPVNGQAFKAAHMALIPVDTPGPHPNHLGHVIVWDQNEATESATSLQRWAIVDPEGQQFWNYNLALPGTNAPSTTPNYNVDGDLFCSGHSWTKNGRLFVAGGSIYKDNLDHLDLVFGARLTWLWKPEDYDDTTASDHGWYQNSPLAQSRYYPSVTLLGDDKLMVTGGLDDAANYPNIAPNLWPSTYEVGLPDTVPTTPITWDMDGSQVRIYQGVVEPNGSHLQWYPRMHLLTTSTQMLPSSQNPTTGDVFHAGFGASNARLLHDPANTAAPPWDYTVGNHPTLATSVYAQLYRHYNSSVLLPLDLNVTTPVLNRVMRMGGSEGTFYFTESNPKADVEICNAGTSGAGGDWQPAQPMHHARIYHTAVLLPDASVLVLGGQDLNGFVTKAELYQNGAWTETGDLNSPRDYHSVVVLLPSGKVFVGGGEHRAWDYEIYNPPYMYKGPKPVLSTWPGSMGYGGVYDIDFTWSGSGPDTYVEKVVLMRPGSITHHSDFDQRYVALNQVEVTSQQPGMVRVTAPPNSKYAPRGRYMMFLVSEMGVPSAAKWVDLQ